MKIAVGCDHGGYVLLQAVSDHLRAQGHEVSTYGSLDGQRVEYPEVAFEVAERVVHGEADLGILMCGTGIGMSIAANKVKGIRCAHVTESYSARMAHRHNNANIIALGGRTLGDQLALEIIDAFLDETFEGGRHHERLSMIADYEER